MTLPGSQLPLRMRFPGFFFRFHEFGKRANLSKINKERDRQRRIHLLNIRLARMHGMDDGNTEPHGAEVAIGISDQE